MPKTGVLVGFGYGVAGGPRVYLVSPGHSEALMIDGATRRRRLRRQVLGFSLAGGTALIVDLAVFNLLINLGISANQASIYAVAAALITNYLGNQKAFRPEDRFGRLMSLRAVKFGLVAAVSSAYLLVAFQVVLLFAPDATPLFYSVFRVGILCSGTLLRFLVLRSWVFDSR